jgi:hypothetical protein
MRKVQMFHIPASERDTGTEIIHTPEERRVEDFDCDDDGGIAMATFSGPFAEERARWYAKRLGGRRPRD